MKKIFQKIKFQTGLTVLFLMIILCSIFGMFFTSFWIYQEKMKENVASSRTDVLHQISSKITLVQKSMIGLSNLYESSIMEYVLDKNKISKSDISMLQANMNALELSYKNAMNIIDVPFHTVLVGNNGLVFVTGHEYEVYDYATLCRKKWFLEIPEEGLFWTRTHTETDNGQFFVSLARNVYTERGKRGTLLVSVSEKAIYETYKNVVGDNNNIYIVDQSGKIISQNHTSLIGETYQYYAQLQELPEEEDYTIVKKENENYLLSRYVDEEYGWSYIEEIPMKDILVSVQDVRTMILIVAVVMSMFAFVIVLLMVKLTTQPILKLSNKLKRVSTGDFETEFDVSGWKEITYINNESAKMVKQISKLIKNIKKEETLKRNAELKTLRMQINPHFMYNTLFSIKCMISLEENEKAEEMLGAFIALLHEVLDNNGQTIPLAEELAIVDQYLIILKYRFGDSFKVEYDIDAQTEQCHVLKMIMQPIIENCVIHGIEPQSGVGHIRIKSYLRAENLIIEVSDNGIGMSEERLEEERKKLEDKTTDFTLSKSIGNRNVNQRIYINYGEEYGLKLEKNDFGGITTILILPQIYH